MRARATDGSDLFHTFHLEDLVPQGHPLRPIKQRADAILRGMSRQFNEAYGKTGRPSVPPERRNAMKMIRHARKRQSLTVTTAGTDAGYDDGAFLNELESEGVTPHVAIRRGPIVAQDAAGEARRRGRGRMRTAAYALSQRLRKRVEEVFGWCKTIGGLARSRFVGRWKLQMQSEITGAAYNMLRMSRLIVKAA